MNLIFGFCLMLLTAGVLTTEAAYILEKCFDHRECEPENSQCQIISPTCHSGSCTCTPGHSPDLNYTTCKRSVIGVGSSCYFRQDVCVTPRAFCSPQAGNACSCIKGHRQHDDGVVSSCLPETMSSAFGQQCIQSDECFVQMVCSNSTLTCECRPGYRMLSQYECIPRIYGESCSTDVDCSATANLICKDGHCQCSLGSTAKRIVFETKPFVYDVRPICHSWGVEPGGEGAACNMDETHGTLTYCKPPFLCKFCGTSWICARPVPKYISQASKIYFQRQSSTTISAFSSSAIILLLWEFFYS